MDGFVKLKENWIAICTSEDEDDSSFKAQEIFAEGESKIAAVPLNRWFREWN